MLDTHQPHPPAETRFVTDGGMETDLIFHQGVDLPEFAAFPLLEDATGRRLLADYYGGYAAVAAAAGAHLMLESPTWRANPDWGARLGYDRDALRRNNESAIGFLRELAQRYRGSMPGVRVNGMVGPRGDGYLASGANVDSDAAADYHHDQIAAFAAAGAEVVTAYTLTGTGEAIGIVRAARDVGVPVAISFTVETDGRLPDGMTVADAVGRVDTAAAPDYYLLNCAHPEHMLAGIPTRDDRAGWASWRRVAGIRANASVQSHAELDEAETLDEGDLTQLVSSTGRLRALLGSLMILGGCCGTDDRHVAALWGVGKPHG
ncbi:MAG: homocysteine S-methyltransferase family protein [Tetrasphaera sp.]